MMLTSFPYYKVKIEACVGNIDLEKAYERAMKEKEGLVGGISTESILKQIQYQLDAWRKSK